MADHAHNQTVSSWTTTGPVGTSTRGTTHQNRLRKSDRWSLTSPRVQDALLSTQKPLAADIGYGASWRTTTEWAGWIRRINPRTEVVGLEIDPQRIFPPQDGVRFELGGFELAGYTAHLIRAFNVLRQYDYSQVKDTWELLQQSLAPEGIIIEGTCDEIGRRATWVVLDKYQPLSLVLAWAPHYLPTPSDIAERLPKALIHKNTPGHPIHEILRTADQAWAQSSAYAPFGPRYQWRETLELLHKDLPEIPLPARYSRDNVLEIPWNLLDS